MLATRPLPDRSWPRSSSRFGFKYNWVDLLEPAPVVFSAIGALRLSSVGEDATKVTLSTPPSGKFKYLNTTSLSQALANCGDRGRLAFLELDTGLGQVTNTLQMIKVNDILACIREDGPRPAKILIHLLETAMNAADNCLESVAGVDKKFEEWLLYTTELYSACIGTQSSDENKIGAIAIGLIVEQSCFDSDYPATWAAAKAVSEKLGNQLDATSEAFKRISDNFPSGWDILGQQVALTAYASDLNPVAKASAGLGMFGDLIHGTAPQQPPPTLKLPAPASSRDPAYSAVQKDIPWISTLYVLLTSGENGGLNWAEAGGSSEYVHQVLQDAATVFSGLASNDPPSTDLKEILSTCVDVSAAILAEWKKGAAADNTFPKADTAQVKDWQTKLQNSYAKVEEMVAIAKALPGGTPAGIQLMADAPDPIDILGKANPKSAQALGALELLDSDNSATNLQDQENKLKAVQAQLKQLNETKIGLEEVKTVLEDTIKLIVNMKIQVMNLFSFFRAISALIGDVSQFNASSYLDQIQGTMNGGGYTKTIGPYSFTDFQRSLVYSSVLTIHSHFSVCTDITTMWLKVYNPSIGEGFALLDKVARQQDLSHRRAFIGQLNEWDDDTLDQIKTLAKTTQNEVQDERSRTRQKLESTTSQIPASPAMIKAIQDGTGAVKQAVWDAIKDNAAARPLIRFAPK